MKEIIELCIKEANKCLETGDVPIGAVIVDNNGQIVAKAHNTREKYHNILGHAEISAIVEASKYLKRWNLADCSLYVTLKPCSMCQEIIKQSRIKEVFYLLDKLEQKKEFSKTKIEKIVENNENYHEQLYLEMLQGFFKQKR